MKPENLLNDAFLKQFKNGLELTNFLEQLHESRIKKILEGELYAHLDYEKHQKRKETNLRNGYKKNKNIKLYTVPTKETIKVALEDFKSKLVI